METPTPTPSPNPNPIQSNPKTKLPIKRKTPHPPPNPIPNPNPYDDEFDDDDDDDGDDEDLDSDESEFPTPIPESTLPLAIPTRTETLTPPPFKFHRIWSESDEIRFLQGLLACFSQHLVFPRDLNIFYDRFSDSMPTPYTRSQLSEKLRRLRNKFRVMSTRIARGQDPDRLAPHDRDLLHLCTRLWDPSHASTSPFSDSSAAAAAGTGTATGNKRRRPNPKVLPVVGEENVVVAEEKVHNGEARKVEEEGFGARKVEGGFRVERVVLDVFEEAVREVGMRVKGAGAGGIERRWREQRVAELEVFARRLRLVLAQSLGNC